MTILERLRVETRPAHERIEQAIDLQRRMSSLAGYREIIERFYGFHIAWEPLAAELIADSEFFEPRRKTNLLLRDLRALGSLGREIADLPVCDRTASFPNAAAAFGSMYVIEGSTLGGAVISRHVKRTLGLGPDTGSAYFGGYGPATGRMWAAFRSRLLMISCPATEDVIVASAQRTFAIMQAWLCEPEGVTA